MKKEKRIVVLAHKDWTGNHVSCLNKVFGGNRDASDDDYGSGSGSGDSGGDDSGRNIMDREDDKLGGGKPVAASGHI